MSVAHDLNLIEEANRQKIAQRLVAEISERLQSIRARESALESGDDEIWRDLRVFALEVIQRASTLDLGLLAACAKEVLHFSNRRFAIGARKEAIVTYMQSALDTLAMELDRLRREHEPR